MAFASSLYLKMSSFARIKSEYKDIKKLRDGYAASTIAKQTISNYLQSSDYKLRVYNDSLCVYPSIFYICSSALFVRGWNLYMVNI